MVTVASPVMTIPEFSRLTGISESTCYKEARAGRLPVPTIYIGRRMLLSRAKVQEVFGKNIDTNDIER
jgi:excisionase family DNA binding protein